MNFKELAENIGLDEDEFLEIVELFIEVSFSDIDHLLSAIEEEDAQKVVEAAHSIKGAAGNLGFMEIFEDAKEVEMKARENSLDGASEAVRIIKEKFDLLRKNFKAKMFK